MGEIAEKSQELSLLIMEISTLGHINLTGDFEIALENEMVYLQLKQEILECYEYLQRTRQRFLHDEVFRKELTSDLCWVEFQNEEYQLLLLEKYGIQRREIKKNLFEYFLEALIPKTTELYFKHEHPITLSRAPEPSEINWVNCELQYQYWRIVIIWLATLFLLAVSISIGQLINHIMRKTQENNFVADLLVFIQIRVFGQFIWVRLLRSVSFEKNKTKSEDIISAINKASFFQDCNSILAPIIIQIYQENQLVGMDGISSSALDFQLVSFVFMLLWQLVDPIYQFSKLRHFLNSLLRNIEFHNSLTLKKFYKGY